MFIPYGWFYWPLPKPKEPEKPAPPTWRQKMTIWRAQRKARA